LIWFTTYSQPFSVSQQNLYTYSVLHFFTGISASYYKGHLSLAILAWLGRMSTGHGYGHF